jgi:hypothetical protein
MKNGSFFRHSVPDLVMLLSAVFWREASCALVWRHSFLGRGNETLAQKAKGRILIRP